MNIYDNREVSEYELAPETSAKILKVLAVAVFLLLIAFFSILYLMYSISPIIYSLNLK